MRDTGDEGRVSISGSPGKRKGRHHIPGSRGSRLGTLGSVLVSDLTTLQALSAQQDQLAAAQGSVALNLAEDYRALDPFLIE